jgi:hypothetical protein
MAVLCLALLVGVGVFGLCTPNISEQWGSWAIGAAFGALAVVVAVFGVAVDTNAFLVEQRQVSLTMLQKNHAELIRAALDHPHLAETWRTPDDHHLTTEELQQRLYSYQRLQVIFAYWVSGEHSDAQVKAALKRAFQSPIMRYVWWSTAPDREEVVVPRTAEHAFYQLANAAYVLAEKTADPQGANSLECPPSRAPESTA